MPAREIGFENVGYDGIIDGCNQTTRSGMGTNIFEFLLYFPSSILIVQQLVVIFHQKIASTIT